MSCCSSGMSSLRGARATIRACVFIISSSFSACSRWRRPALAQPAAPPAAAGTGRRRRRGQPPQDPNASAAGRNSAAQRRAQQYGYHGRRTRSRTTPGTGYCYEQGAHFHEYPPFDQNLFREQGGWFYFVGDAGDFGYSQQMWGYRGHHPIPGALRRRLLLHRLAASPPLRAGGRASPTTSSAATTTTPGRSTPGTGAGGRTTRPTTATTTASSYYGGIYWRDAAGADLSAARRRRCAGRLSSGRGRRGAGRRARARGGAASVWAAGRGRRRAAAVCAGPAAGRGRRCAAAVCAGAAAGRRRGRAASVRAGAASGRCRRRAASVRAGTASRRMRRRRRPVVVPALASHAPPPAAPRRRMTVGSRRPSRHQPLGSFAMKRVLILHTGGTLGMSARRPSALAPDTYAHEIVTRVPELAALATIDTRILCNLDSSDVGPDEWSALADEIAAARAPATTGSSSSTAPTRWPTRAAALSFALVGLDQPGGADRLAAAARRDPLRRAAQPRRRGRSGDARHPRGRRLLRRARSCAAIAPPRATPGRTPRSPRPTARRWRGSGSTSRSRRTCAGRAGGLRRRRALRRARGGGLRDAGYGSAHRRAARRRRRPRRRARRGAGGVRRGQRAVADALGGGGGAPARRRRRHGGGGDAGARRRGRSVALRQRRRAARRGRGGRRRHGRRGGGGQADARARPLPRRRARRAPTTSSRDVAGERGDGLLHLRD